MYRPPQNCNRVKSIKKKFENIENQSETVNVGPSKPFTSAKKLLAPLTENSLNGFSREHNARSSIPQRAAQPSLSRQLSDPAKRNIKRTPAFRVDKSAEDSPVRPTSLFQTKIKQFNRVKCGKELDSPSDDSTGGLKCDLIEFDKHTVSCDSVSLKENSSFLYPRNKLDVYSSTNKTEVPRNKRASLIKSKSSQDFQYVRKKFDDEPENLSTEILSTANIDLSLLYTQPIPKSLRHKTTETNCTSKIDNIYTKSTLQLTDNDKKEFLNSLQRVLARQDLPGGLTDSLRVALKKPLPKGPAPQKPPRTFQHCAEAVINEKRKTPKKGDPRYMLNKLEMALKNNKLRVRKQLPRVEVCSTTSGEDSDDSLLFRSKSCRSVHKEDTEDGGFDNLLGEFNCFGGFGGCGNPGYQRLKEPSASFFVSASPEKEHIYDEPVRRKSSEVESEKTKNRNSLYYMSTALIPEDTGQNGGGPSNLKGATMDDSKAELSSSRVNRQISAEDSSLSSFTSDLDSNPSPVADDPHAKIRFLIENFEKRRQTLPKVNGEDREGEPARSFSVSSDSASRVEALKDSLRKTLDRSFNSDASLAGARESDSENFEDGKVSRMVERFHTFQKSAPKYQQPSVNTDTLFDCCLVIEKVQDCVRIKFKFPENVDIPKNIEYLCFPESPESPPLEGTSTAQSYTLLITSETGVRTYGYCRRVLPEGSNHCLPLVYCILSKYRLPRFYKKVLLELESRHGMQNKYRDRLISQFYFKKIPKPGDSITINLSGLDGGGDKTSAFEGSLDLTSFIQVNKTGEYGTLTHKRTEIFVSPNDAVAPNFVSYDGAKTELVLTMHDARYEVAELKRLHKLPADVLLKIFSSLLLERKVILISSVISELSSCVDSLQSILYPFTWCHTFIPIIPEPLWDILDCPTPIVCGVLSQDAMEGRHVENAIVVNVDTKSVLIEEGDELKILSGSLHKVWRQFMTLASNIQSNEFVYSFYLADAYLSVFITCFKSYKQYVVEGQFLKDELIKNAKTKGIRRFLKMFTETGMFQGFVDAALHNPDTLALFDKKIELFGSDQSSSILDKLIEWHR
ncbi:DENN domain-containing protein 2B-like [Anthonomus grandis grandis]|uniref:DENN domain-containing protein 2B-like n=1 Tax=Anthonomus grandis grandis TaxID=2921223 RepID=UPI002165D912|nr:DENN domain-containing protein 2B-like [Anthonomus grandis grandis]